MTNFPEDPQQPGLPGATVSGESSSGTGPRPAKRAPGHYTDFVMKTGREPSYDEWEQHAKLYAHLDAMDSRTADKILGQVVPSEIPSRSEPGGAIWQKYPMAVKLGDYAFDMADYQRRTEIRRPGRRRMEGGDR
jgi:hypothetical protein